MDRDAFALALPTMALTAQLWSMSFPSRREVAAMPATRENVSGVYSDCLSCGGGALLIAAAASWACRSWAPLLCSAALIGYLSAAYSTAARTGGAPTATVSAPATVQRYA